MWKQGKRQINSSFAPSKPQNNHRRSNNGGHRSNQQSEGGQERSEYRQDRGGSNDRNHNNYQNRRPVTYNRHQTIDSQGPEVKVRGTISQIIEKYAGLARDANISGDRVLAESLLQHAEHYTRIWNEIAAESAARAAEMPQPVIAPVPMIDPSEQPQPVVIHTAPVAPPAPTENQDQNSQPIF
jgi:hypothetical protein